MRVCAAACGGELVCVYLTFCSISHISLLLRDLFVSENIHKPEDDSLSTSLSQLQRHGFVDNIIKKLKSNASVS